MGKIIALWTSPRSVSTAIYKAFDQRTDTLCSYEPYNDCFYFSHERKSNKYGERKEREDYTSSEVFRELVESASNAEILFVKDMAFMANPYLTDAQLSKITSGFIIRDPSRTIQSIKRVKPNFDRIDFGYCELANMFDRLTNELQMKPIVVDGDRVKVAPKAQLMHLCNALGISYQEEMLSWQEGHVRTWEPYELSSHERWHKKLITTRGFEAQQSSLPDQELTTEEQSILSEAKEVYERLREYSI
ncbi:sulfotransferase-like domain-containing protein [Roseibium sp. M-1]